MAERTFQGGGRSGLNNSKSGHGFSLNTTSSLLDDPYDNDVILSQPSNQNNSNIKVAKFLNRFQNEGESIGTAESFSPFAPTQNHFNQRHRENWNNNSSNSSDSLRKQPSLNWGNTMEMNHGFKSQSDANIDRSFPLHSDPRNKLAHSRSFYDLMQDNSDPRTPSPVSALDNSRRFSKASSISTQNEYYGESSQEYIKNPMYRHSFASQQDLWSQEGITYIDSPIDDAPRFGFPTVKNRLSPPQRASSTPPFQLQAGIKNSQIGTPVRETAYNELFSALTGLSIDDSHEEPHHDRFYDKGYGQNYSSAFAQRNRNTLRNTSSVSDLNQTWETSDPSFTPAPTLGRSASYYGSRQDSSSSERSSRYGLSRINSFYNNNQLPRHNQPSSIKASSVQFTPARARSVNESKLRNETSSPSLGHQQLSQQQLIQAREQILLQQELLNYRNNNKTPDRFLGDDSQAEGGSSLRSRTLEEFRTSKNKKFELRDIVGFMVEFSGDQHGSRFIQQKLETASSEDKQLVFDEILPNVLQLMTDVFGNYVIQKFFEHGSQIQKTVLFRLMDGHILSLSLQMYGCRVVQKAIEHILVDQQAKLIGELEGNIIKCVKDQNGNHVVQKAIERIPARHIQFIIDAFNGQVIALATHPYGCRVIQRMLEHCNEAQTRYLMGEIHSNTQFLIQDQYGNYVIQHVMERGKSVDRSEVVKKILGQAFQLSKHKFASNVVEKCVAHGTKIERQLLIEEVLMPGDDGASPLIHMVKDQFANYVVQKMLDVVDGSQREMLILKLKPHLSSLRKFTYGKHLISKVEKIITQIKRTQRNSPTIDSAQVSSLNLESNSGDSGIHLIENS